MCINIENAKQEFLKYTEQFNLEDEDIKRKQQHSLRVMAISEEIAKSLGLSKEEIDLATLIGILHDIGRFEQYQTIGLGDTIKGFDHGDYGTEILNKDIRKFIETDKYDEIIKKAVKNHSKYKIEEGLNEKELFFTKLIRDADKIDILFEAEGMLWKGFEKNINNSKVSEDIEKQFKNYLTIKKDKRQDDTKTVDNAISTIAYVFDINFDKSLKIIKEQNYIDRIINRFDFKYKETIDKVEELGDIAKEYIDKRIENFSK